MTEEFEKRKQLLIEVPMPIRTDRLIIRPPLPGDGQLVHEAKMESWDDLKQWMTWAREKPTQDEDEAKSREGQARFILREDIPLYGFEIDSKGNEGMLVMGGGLHGFDWVKRRFDIGYWVRSSAQGKGYAQEFTNAITRYAFSVLGAKAVVIEHAEGNENSRRVIEKLGFIKEGVAQMDAALPDGTQTNRHIYARTGMEGLPSLSVRWG